MNERKVPQTVIKAFGKNVLLWVTKEGETVKGGVILPANVKANSYAPRGTVVSVGSDIPVASGLTAGVVVAFKSYTGATIKETDHHELRAIHIDDIFAIVD